MLVLTKYPGIKIGFSMFCKRRPKWCITTNSSGSHNVCVCTHHQNVKLLVDATMLTESYKELMEKLVCSRQSTDRTTLITQTLPIQEFI